VTENILKLQNNAHFDFSYDLDFMLSIGEGGKGTLLTTKLQNISPKNSYVKARTKLMPKKSIGIKDKMENLIGSNLEKRNEYDFNLCFDILKEWTLHKIVR